MSDYKGNNPLVRMGMTAGLLNRQAWRPPVLRSMETLVSGIKRNSQPIIERISAFAAWHGQLSKRAEPMSFWPQLSIEQGYNPYNQTEPTTEKGNTSVSVKQPGTNFAAFPSKAGIKITQDIHSIETINRPTIKIAILYKTENQAPEERKINRQKSVPQYSQRRRSNLMTFVQAGDIQTHKPVNLAPETNSVSTLLKNMDDSSSSRNLGLGKDMKLPTFSYESISYHKLPVLTPEAESRDVFVSKLPVHRIEVRGGFPAQNPEDSTALRKVTQQDNSPQQLIGRYKYVDGTNALRTVNVEKSQRDSESEQMSQVQMPQVQMPQVQRSQVQRPKTSDDLPIGSPSGEKNSFDILFEQASRGTAIPEVEILIKKDRQEEKVRQISHFEETSHMIQDYNFKETESGFSTTASGSPVQNTNSNSTQVDIDMVTERVHKAIQGRDQLEKNRKGWY